MLKRIFIILVDILIILLILYFILGYFNFYRVSKQEEPYLIFDEKTYEVETGTVKVYDGKIYKIISHKIDGGDTTLRIKLWFMSDLDN